MWKSDFYLDEYLKYAEFGDRWREPAQKARPDRERLPGFWEELTSLGFFDGVLGHRETFEAAAARFEGLSYGLRDPGLMNSVLVHHCVSRVVARFGSPAAVEHYEKRIERVPRPSSVAMTEPDGGTDAFDLKTCLSSRGEELVLDGHKWHITNAPHSAMSLVFAFDEEAQAPTAVLVDSDSPGIECRPLRASGMRSSPIGELIFRNVAIAPHRVIGGRGRGVGVFHSATMRERVLIAFAICGQQQRVFEDAFRHAQTRMTFGKPIGSYQYVRKRLTDMKVGLEATRGLAHAALAMQRGGSDYSVESATAKLFAADYAVQANIDAMKLFGSQGYEEGGLSDLVLGCIGATLGGGSEEAQREIIYKGLYRNYRRRERSGNEELPILAAVAEG